MAIKSRFGPVVVLLLAFLIAIWRIPGDPLDVLQPYAEASTVAYYDPTKFPPPSAHVKRTPIFYRRLRVKNLTKEELVVLVKTKLLNGRGWSTNTIEPKGFWATREANSDEGGLEISVFELNRKLFVLETRPMSQIEVIMVALRNYGRDPYTQPKHAIGPE